jgi:hypothetical protein
MWSSARVELLLVLTAISDAMNNKTDRRVEFPIEGQSDESAKDELPVSYRRKRNTEREVRTATASEEKRTTTLGKSAVGLPHPGATVSPTVSPHVYSTSVTGRASNTAGLTNC